MLSNMTQVCSVMLLGAEVGCARVAVCLAMVASCFAKLALSSLSIFDPSRC